MITKSELLETAKLKGISNAGYAEKDYLLELLLFSLAKNTKQELIFKGGTALYKFYKLERFSEDLDFSEAGMTDIDTLIKKTLLDLSRFRVETESFKVREPFDTVLITFRTKGPLYDGRSQTLSSLRVDINRKSAVELKPLRLRLASLYTEIPPFYMLVMQEREILAEKIRAIIARNKARDLFDAFALIEKGTEVDSDLIEKKLKYYSLEFSKKGLSGAIDKKQNLWANELKHLLNEAPSFIDVKRKVLSVF